MNYKEFGIYVDEKNVKVIIGKENEEFLVYYIHLSELDELSNSRINKYLVKSFHNNVHRRLITLDFVNNPNLYKDMGYLGQVDENMQEVMRQLSDYMSESI